MRPVLILWLDISTGTIVGYRVCLTENKDATRNSLMDGICRFGIPKKIRIDNGGAYKYVEYAPLRYYTEAKGKQRLTTSEKIAKRMLESGDKGLYGNLGIDYRFTLPGNPESKSIEPFWKYGLAVFEKSFLSWAGNKAELRPEVLAGMENKILVRKHGEKFPTWDEFCEKLDQYIIFYNSKVRASLSTADGKELSPIEVYNQVEHIIPNPIEIQSKMRDPYIEMRVVQRSFIEKNGILYWHPLFASMIGKKVGIYYDEKNLHEITICNDRGQVYPDKAISIDPGLQSGDDLTMLIENNRRAKISKAFYLAHCNVAGANKIEKMLKLISNELLPLSSCIEAEEVRYLNFDEALEAIAGEEEYVEDIETKPETELSDEDKEIRESLKKDLEGMFGC